MSGTRKRRADINSAIDYLLSNSQNHQEPNPKPLPIMYCQKINIGPVIGRDGAICPYCNDVLKNKATLNVHMKRCNMTPVSDFDSLEQGPETFQQRESSPSPKIRVN